MKRSTASWLLLTSVALAQLGCGSDSASAGGAAAGASGAGAGGAGAGGESGADDGYIPRAQGSATLTLGPATTPDTGFSCPVSQTYLVGDPAPSESSAGTPLLDGQGAMVNCTVTQPAAYFTFSASLIAAIPGGQLQLTFISPTVRTTAALPAQGSVFTSDLAGTLLSSTTDPAGACSLSVVNDQIQPGAFWGTFSCPKLTFAPSTQCAASGVFVFQNCIEN